MLKAIFNSVRSSMQVDVGVRLQIICGTGDNRYVVEGIVTELADDYLLVKKDDGGVTVVLIEAIESFTKLDALAASVPSKPKAPSVYRRFGTLMPPYYDFNVKRWLEQTRARIKELDDRALMSTMNGICESFGNALKNHDVKNKYNETLRARILSSWNECRAELDFEVFCMLLGGAAVAADDYDYARRPLIQLGKYSIAAYAALKADRVEDANVFTLCSLLSGETNDINRKVADICIDRNDSDVLRKLLEVFKDDDEALEKLATCAHMMFEASGGKLKSDITDELDAYEAASRLLDSIPLGWSRPSAILTRLNEYRNYSYPLERGGVEDSSMPQRLVGCVTRFGPGVFGMIGTHYFHVKQVYNGSTNGLLLRKMLHLGLWEGLEVGFRLGESISPNYSTQATHIELTEEGVRRAEQILAFNGRRDEARLVSIENDPYIQYVYFELEPYGEKSAKPNRAVLNWLGIPTQRTSTQDPIVIIGTPAPPSDPKEEKKLLSALKTYGFNQTVVGNLINLYIREDRAQKALALMDQYGAYMERAKCLNMRAMILDKLKDYEKLCPLYEEILKLEVNPAAWSHRMMTLITAYMKLSRYDDALKACQRWKDFYKRNKNNLGVNWFNALATVERQMEECRQQLSKRPGVNSFNKIVVEPSNKSRDKKIEPPRGVGDAIVHVINRIDPLGDGTPDYSKVLAAYGSTPETRETFVEKLSNRLKAQYDEGILIWNVGSFKEFNVGDAESAEDYAARFLHRMLDVGSEVVEDNGDLCDLLEQEAPLFKILQRPDRAVEYFDEYMIGLNEVLKRERKIIVLILEDFTALREPLDSGKIPVEFLRFSKRVMEQYRIFWVLTADGDMEEFMEKYGGELPVVELQPLKD